MWSNTPNSWPNGCSDLPPALVARIWLPAPTVVFHKVRWARACIAPSCGQSSRHWRKVPGSRAANSGASARRHDCAAVQLQHQNSRRGILTAARSEHPFDPLRARRPRLERVGEILDLASHLAIEELHDAHGVRRPLVISQDIFSDPEVARADYPPHREAFPVRLRAARGLN